MARKQTEDDGATDKRTEYPEQERPGAKPGTVMSGWALAAGAACFLVIVMGLWLA